VLLNALLKRLSQSEQKGKQKSGLRPKWAYSQLKSAKNTKVEL